VVNLIQRWRIQNGDLILEPHAPRLVDRFHLLRDYVESCLHRQTLSRASRYTIRSLAEDQCKLWQQQTAAPVSYLEHKFTRLQNATAESE
jgi:hypothetical protein